MQQKYIALVLKKNGQLYPKYADIIDLNDSLKKNISINETSNQWTFKSKHLHLSAKIGERANSNFIEEDAIIGIFSVPANYDTTILNFLVAKARNLF